MPKNESVRIAMWSGPRNISTAMMRSWGNRPDTFVCDEPFYAHYLHATGRAHPGAEEVIARGETDWRKVIDDPAVEAVFIAAPNMVHVELVEAVAQAGKAVFCEKPVGGTPKESVTAASNQQMAPALMPASTTPASHASWRMASTP